MYGIAAKLASRFEVALMAIDGDENHPGRVHAQHLFHTLRLFAIAHRARGRTIVIAQRVASPIFRVVLLAIWHKITREKLVYDFDDAIYLIHPRAVEYLCREADAVTVSNQHLKAYANRHNSQAFIVPTSIDLDVYRKEPSNHSGPPVVGWIGTSFSFAYLKMLERPLLRLRQRTDFEFHIISDYSKRSDIPLTSRVPTRVVNWTYPGFVRDLSGFDIGVCPLPLDTWTQGKSGYKTLEYMALGIPVVASPVGDNSNVVRDGVNGYLAHTEDDWVDRLERLMRDAGLRTRMGVAGMRMVQTSYSLDQAARKVEQVVSALCRDALDTND